MMNSMRSKSVMCVFMASVLLLASCGISSRPKLRIPIPKGFRIENANPCSSNVGAISESGECGGSWEVVSRDRKYDWEYVLNFYKKKYPQQVSSGRSMELPNGKTLEMSLHWVGKSKIRGANVSADLEKSQGCSRTAHQPYDGQYYWDCSFPKLKDIVASFRIVQSFPGPQSARFPDTQTPSSEHARSEIDF